MSLLTTSLRCLAAGAALLALLPGARAARPESPFPIREILLLDTLQAIDKADIDVAVFIAPESCTPKTHISTWGTVVSSDNDSLFRSWACRAYVDAAKDPTEKLAFIPMPTALKQPSILATVQALPPSPTGRRYVALLDATLTDLSQRKNCSSCSFSFLMQSEVVVYDRIAGKAVWHSIDTKSSHLRDGVYSSATSRMLGPLLVSGTLTDVTMQRGLGEADSAGVRRTTALESAATPQQTGMQLNKKANLIIFNRMPQATANSEGFDNGNTYYWINAGHLEGKAKETRYTSYSKTHTALELAPGKYTLSFFNKAPIPVEIKTDGPPTYLSFSNGFLRSTSVSELNATEALALVQDSVNLMIPELTPVAYPLRARKLQWTQP